MRLMMANVCIFTTENLSEKCVNQPARILRDTNLSDDTISHQSVHAIIEVASQEIWWFAVVPILNSQFVEKNQMSPFPPFVRIADL